MNNRIPKNSVTTLSISETRKHFSSMDKRLRDDRVIFVTRHNKKAFAAVDLDYLKTILEAAGIVPR